MALSEINPDDITAPISVSHYCRDRHISFSRSKLLEAVRNLGIRAHLLPYPSSSGALKEQVVMLPREYDLQGYPYETIPAKVLKLLPCTRAGLTAKLKVSAKQVDNALCFLLRSGAISKVGASYRVRQ